MDMKKIVVIGPESTGKSTLCHQLADYYHTVWCPEFAREYLLERGMNYSFEDLLHIAHGQLKLEEILLPQATNLYFIDTDMYVMKVWCEVAFQNCHSWILKQIGKRHYDLYLLCQTDLPWKADDLREYSDIRIRERLYKMYKDIVINSGTMWAEIGGTDTQRLQMATSVINAVFKGNVY